MLFFHGPWTLTGSRDLVFDLDNLAVFYSYSHMLHLSSDTKHSIVEWRKVLFSMPYISWGRDSSHFVKVVKNTIWTLLIVSSIGLSWCDTGIEKKCWHGTHTSVSFKRKKVIKNENIFFNCWCVLIRLISTVWLYEPAGKFYVVCSSIYNTDIRDA